MSSGAAVVIQTSFLGDLVLTTPLLAHLASRGLVDVVTTPAGAPLLARHPAVRDVIVYDKRHDDRGLHGLGRTARRLRLRQYAAAYHAQGSMRSATLSWLARIPDRIGFDTSPGRVLYTRRVAYRRDLHHAARLLSLGDPLGAAGDPPAPRLFPGDEERAAADAVLGAPAASVVPVVALAPGSIWGTKRWPGYPALARALVARGARVVVIGGPDDAALAADVVAAAGPGAPHELSGRGAPSNAAPRIVDATGRLSLLASAEVIRRCALLVTNDSLPQHLASAMGTPTVTIFGPTVPAFGFGPLAPRSLTIGLEGLDCRPCHPHGPATCPRGHFKCMRELDAPRVIAAAERVLAQVLPRGA